MIQFSNRVTITWIILVFATCLSLLVGKQNRRIEADAVILMIIALFKMRLVLLQFMDVRDAPRNWRVVLEGWLAILGFAMIGTYFLAR